MKTIIAFRNTGDTIIQNVSATIIANRNQLSSNAVQPKRICNSEVVCSFFGTSLLIKSIMHKIAEKIPLLLAEVIKGHLWWCK